MILNMSPMPDGTFPQRQKDILAAFGKFLRQMGTAIYETRAWVVYGEGPTKMGGGEFTSPTALTANDVRYTKSKDGDTVYAILGGWPGNGKQVNLTAVTTSRFALGSGKVFLFGPTGGAAIELQATQDGSGLHVTLPSTQPYTAVAYAMKISKSGVVPGPTPWLDGGGTNADAGVSQTGGSGGTQDAAPVRTDGGAGAGGRDGAIVGSGGIPGAGGAMAGGAVGGVNGGAGGAVNGGTGGAGSTGSRDGAAGGTEPSARGGSAGNAGGAVSSGGSRTGGTVAVSSSAGGAVGTSGASGGSTASRTTPESNSAAGCSCATFGGAHTSATGLLFLLVGIALVTCRCRR